VRGIKIVNLSEAAGMAGEESEQLLVRLAVEKTYLRSSGASEVLPFATALGQFFRQKRRRMCPDELRSKFGRGT
jgi:hypothetical protein